MLAPSEILEKWIVSGKAKARNSVCKLFLLAVFAGVFIAIAGVGSTIASAAIENPSAAKLIGACVFPGGLAMCLLAGSELFTGNTLILIPVLSKEASVAGMLKNWVTVFIGNFVGSILIALAVNYGGTLGLFGNAAAQSAVNTAAAKVTLTFSDAFIRGILCNFLVCIAVWIAAGAQSAGGKLAGLFFPIMIFVLSGYEHSIANMYYIPAGIIAQNTYPIAGNNALTWGAFLLNNLLPVTLGNILGGGVTVGVVYTLVYRKKA
ncbi:MAG: formate/nitrite transporter family protein [Oscillospiraceae bacterium]|jgi:formate/nitrite transporter|nr:formate/nitrite transporter family protein [Oscillospiraceae bacterium]